MKELLKYSSNYVERMNLLDVGLLKVCVGSLGILAGLCVPKGHKKNVGTAAAILWAFTYAPLMTKYLNVILEESKKKA